MMKFLHKEVNNLSDKSSGKMNESEDPKCLINNLLIST